MEEAILHGCIPVIIQDEIHVPFETSLDTSQFAIRYERAKLNSLIEFLSSVSHEEVRMRSPSRPTPRERESSRVVVAETPPSFRTECVRPPSPPARRRTRRRRT
jgi:hypothetical protein